MVAEISNRRSNAQLESILYETANWTVNGRGDMVFREVASLQMALDCADECQVSGHEVVALVRKWPAEIVVFSGQVRTLTERLAAREAVLEVRHALRA
jgi:hypothetical protein